jgi:hypothetical protein
VVSSCICHARRIWIGLSHYSWRNKHLWALASPGIQMTCMLIRLRMRIFIHVKVFVYKIIIDNLMAINVPYLILLAVSIRRRYPQARYGCALLRFELNLWLLYRIALRTYNIWIHSRCRYSLQILWIDEILPFLLLAFLCSKLKLSLILTFRVCDWRHKLSIFCAWIWRMGG